MDLSLTTGRLRALAPKAKQAILDGIVSGQGVLQAYEINTPLRLQHFLAQIAHESAGFKTTVEYWGPTKAQKRYEGREDLGNTRPGDGIRYMGRGLMQLTGRANYRRIGAKLGLPLEEHPEMAAEPIVSLRIACEYWASRKINAMADRDDVEDVTRAINGGHNGLEDRKDYLARARKLWPATLPGVVRPTLRLNETGDAVRELQELLKVGATGRGIGRFGPATERAVMAFQKAKGLNPDGVVGARTWAALLPA